MAITNGYTTLATMRALFRIATVDATEDGLIESAVTASSRAIDTHCNRKFWLDPSATMRVYSPVGSSTPAWSGSGRTSRDLEVHDIATLTGFAVDFDLDGDGVFETAVDPATFWTLPLNAIVDGDPIKWLRRKLAGWPWQEASVRVTAKHGWAAVPSVVRQACEIQAHRLYKRRDAAFGVTGSPEVGGELRLLERLDPDVQVMLSGVRRMWGAR